MPEAWQDENEAKILKNKEKNIIQNLTKENREITSGHKEVKYKFNEIQFHFWSVNCAENNRNGEKLWRKRNKFEKQINATLTEPKGEGRKRDEITWCTQSFEDVAGGSKILATTDSNMVYVNSIFK